MFFVDPKYRLILENEGILSNGLGTNSKTVSMTPWIGSAIGLHNPENSFAAKVAKINATIMGIMNKEAATEEITIVRKFSISLSPNPPYWQILLIFYCMVKTLSRGRGLVPPEMSWQLHLLKKSEPISDEGIGNGFGLHLFGAGNRTRTCTLARWNLNPMRLPIPPCPRMGWFYHGLLELSISRLSASFAFTWGIFCIIMLC